MPELKFNKQLIISIAALFFISACSSNKSRVGSMFNLDTDLRLVFTTGQLVNPDHNTRSSPTVVRLYELNSVSAFEKADFVDIYERDEELLANSLMGKQVLRALVPGEEREERLVLKPGTTHVGLFAEFSDYRRASYKVVFPITQNNVFRDVVKVGLAGNELSLSK